MARVRPFGRAQTESVDMNVSSASLASLALDGAHGKGGGQLLRTAVALAATLLSSHLRTVAWVVRQFLPVDIALADEFPARVELTQGRNDSPRPDA
jgi:hypothetical protein